MRDTAYLYDALGRRLYLTPKGERLYRRLVPENSAANERILAPLSARERETLFDLLIRIIQANAIYARPGAGRRKRADNRVDPHSS